MSRRHRTVDAMAQPTKRQRFEEAGRFPLRKVVIAAAAVSVVVVAVVVGVSIQSRSTEAGGPVLAKGGVSYDGGRVEMSLLTAGQTEGDTITLSVTEVKDRKLGGVVYSRSTPMPAGFAPVDGDGLPLLAYMAPSGKLVVATSLCEPCRSWDFHIDGGDLVCNACFTRWDLNTLAGVRGGCLDYPPEELAVTVEGDLIHIPRADLEAWVPRI